jgi:hypothetical protein
MFLGFAENLQYLKFQGSVATNATNSNTEFDLSGYKAGKVYFMYPKATATDSSVKPTVLTLEYCDTTNGTWATQWAFTTNSVTSAATDVVATANNNTSNPGVIEFNFIPRARYYRVRHQMATGYNTVTILGLGLNGDVLPTTSTLKNVTQAVAASG